MTLCLIAEKRRQLQTGSQLARVSSNFNTIFIRHVRDGHPQFAITWDNQPLKAAARSRRLSHAFQQGG